jgi:hypothetical protein
MVHHIELIHNPSFSPIYFTDTNMIYPVVVITFNSMYEFATKFIEKAFQYAIIISYIFYLMMV